MEAPQYPVGPNPKPEDQPPREALIVILEAAPQALRQAVAGLTEAQLDVKYRNWSIRQIAHHLADSHVNAYVRFKWTLTEDNPTIKAYDENKWSDLEESKKGTLEATLALFEGLHRQWVQLLRTMTEDQFQRTFYHPENKRTSTLASYLGIYAWHCRHHTGQILWMRENKKV